MQSRCRVGAESVQSRCRVGAESLQSRCRVAAVIADSIIQHSLKLKWNVSDTHYVQNTIAIDGGHGIVLGASLCVRVCVCL